MVPWATYNASVVNTQAHQDLALSAAEQSLVLLKNTDGVGKLPWSKEAVKTVAVIGRNADATQNMLGNYFGTPPYIVSPKDGLGKYATTSYADGTDIDAAVKLVATVDAVVLVRWIMVAVLCIAHRCGLLCMSPVKKISPSTDGLAVCACTVSSN